MREIKLAVVQMECSKKRELNIQKAKNKIREAHGKGAQVILLQELFETPYFCQIEDAELYSLATEINENPAILQLKELAKELRVVIPVSFYEKSSQALFNSMAMIDGDGSILGIYRKSHIPDGPGYEEKFYFSPGDTGFKVFETMYGKIGVGICWDQWFPEAARCMVLKGAELLLYPTAIGSEPPAPEVDSKDHWQMCMRGHSACNLVPVAAANRIGLESMNDSEIRFYGSSFITDNKGEILTQAGREDETILYADLDLERFEKERAEWGLFRDRRPELYHSIMTFDGKTQKEQ